MAATEHLALERLGALTQAGAVRAAAAFGQLANAAVAARPPMVCDRSSSRPGAIGSDSALRAASDAGSVTAGVFFEFEGCLEALVGILLPAAGAERLVRGVVGIEAGELDPMIVESALMEVGNILASHVASGIADALHSRLLPSIPALAAQHADLEFDDWVERVAGPDVPRIEAALVLASGELVGRLVVVPTAEAVGDGPGGDARGSSVC